MLLELQYFFQGNPVEAPPTWQDTWEACGEACGEISDQTRGALRGGRPLFSRWMKKARGKKSTLLQEADQKKLYALYVQLNETIVHLMR